MNDDRQDTRPPDQPPDPLELKPDPLELEPDPLELEPDPLKPDPLELKPDPDLAKKEIKEEPNEAGADAPSNVTEDLEDLPLDAALVESSDGTAGSPSPDDDGNKRLASHQRKVTQCDHPGCSHTVLKKNLQRHKRTAHSELYPHGSSGAAPPRKAVYRPPPHGKRGAQKTKKKGGLPSSSRRNKINDRKRKGSPAPAESDEEYPNAEKMMRTAYFSIMASLSHRAFEEAIFLQHLNGVGLGGLPESSSGDEDADPMIIKILRTVYYALTNSLSQRAFEEVIVLQHLNGLEMGKLCHTHAQLERYRRPFNDTVMSAVSRHVGKSPCVSWVVDRVTAVDGVNDFFHVDIVTIVTIVPEAPAGHLVQEFVVGVLDVLYGETTGTHWAGVAPQCGVTDIWKLASISTYGELHREKVPAEFLKKLMASQEDQTGRFATPSVPSLWDADHLVELADVAAGEEPASRWMDDTLETVVRIMDRFMDDEEEEDEEGDGAQSAHRMFSEQIKKTSKLLWPWRKGPRPCRMTELLEDFLEKIPGMVTAMKSMLESPSTTRDDDAKLLADLRLLTDAGGTFLVRVAALRDIYSALGGLPESLQLLPWERQRSSPESRALQLRRMAAALPPAARLPSRSADPAAIRTALMGVQFPGDLKETWPRLSQRADSGMTSEQVNEIRKFIEDLCRHLSSPEQDTKRNSDDEKITKAMADIRRVSDLVMLRSSGPDAPKAVKDALRRLERQHIIPDTGISASLISAVYDTVRPMTEPKTNQELYKQLWEEIKSNPGLSPFLDAVTRLWLICPTRVVVDDLETTVREVFAEHRDLLFTPSCAELVVRCNGPLMNSADGLLDRVQEEHQFEFTLLEPGSGGSLIERKNAEPRTGPKFLFRDMEEDE